MQIERLHTTKANDGQEDSRKDMEADGQGGQAVSAK